jgi:hypothetical protein
MVSRDWSEVYVEIYLNVDYTWGPHGVYDIELNHSSPSYLAHGRFLELDFAYGTTEVDNILIFSLPYTDGSPTPGYTANEPVELDYPAGTGSNWLSFDADADVDAIRFQMWDLAQTVVLLEFDIPVDLHWRSDGITDFEIAPVSPERLPWSAPTSVDFNYQTDRPEGVRVRAVAADELGGTLADQIYDEGSVLPGPEGSSSSSFTFDSGTREVANIKVSLLSADLGQTYVEVLLPVSIAYGPHAISNMTLTPAPPAALTHGERTYIDFDYATTQAGGVRVYHVPLSGGEPIPVVALSDSPLYGATVGTGTNWFRVLAGEWLVDDVRCRMSDQNDSVTLLEFLYPTLRTYSLAGEVTAVDGPPVPGSIVLGDNYPNPFNPLTTIPIIVQDERWVRLRVFDLQGRLVQTLAEGFYGPGRHEIPFSGENLASGIYLYQLEGAGAPQTKRMLLLK